MVRGRPLLAAAPERPFDVVGLGECSHDTVAVVEALPPPGTKRPVETWLELPGGQIATALLACARLGLRTALVSSVGEDAAGEAVLRPLRDAGVDLAAVRSVRGASTRSAFILVERDSGERTVLHHRDPRLRLAREGLRREDVTRGRVLHVDASDLDASVWAAGAAREEGIPVVLDADAAQPGLEALLRCVDFPIVSSAFAEECFGTRSPVEALRRLVAWGARFAVVTLGSRGAVGGAGETVLESPAFPVEVRDTTGAGDVFHAAFIWGLLRGLDAEETLRAANAAAALSCRALGAQGGLPGEAELRELLGTDVP